MSFKNGNKNGQALVESLMALPVLMLGASLVMSGLHGLSTFYFFDHWTYEAALCLAHEDPISTCKENFIKKARLMPFVRYEIVTLQRDSKQVRVQTLVSAPILPKKVFSESFNLPLTSFDFGASQ